MFIILIFHFQFFFKKIDLFKSSFIQFNIMKIINKGTGAGGSKTNFNGKKFENKTNNFNYLLSKGYDKHYLKINKKNIIYLKKEYENNKIKNISFFLQKSFMFYVKKNLILNHVDILMKLL